MRFGVAVILVAALAGPAAADEEPVVDLDPQPEKGTFGIGIIFGEPTGVSAKLYLKDDQALQAAVGLAFIGAGLHAHVDYVFHPYILQSRESFVLPVYIGPGVRTIQYRDGRESNYFAFGARAVGGILFDFKNIPLDAFIEVAGVLEYRTHDGDHVGVAFNAGAGARYYS
jgi:hypothetical protein